MFLRYVGSFGQAGEVDKGPAHPQADEEELGDELEVDEEPSVCQWPPHSPFFSFSFILKERFRFALSPRATRGSTEVYKWSFWSLCTENAFPKRMNAATGDSILLQSQPHCVNSWPADDLQLRRRSQVEPVQLISCCSTEAPALDFTRSPLLSIILCTKCQIKRWQSHKKPKDKSPNKGWTVPLNVDCSFVLLLPPSAALFKGYLKAVWLKMGLGRFQEKCNKAQEGKYIKQSWRWMFCRTARRPIHRGSVFIPSHLWADSHQKVILWRYIRMGLNKICIFVQKTIDG